MDLKPYFKRREHISMTPAVVIGAYSIDQNRNYQDGLKNLKYLNIPEEINFDLNQGLYIEKPSLHPRERIHQLTSFIMHNSKDVIKEKKVDADFVCFRGVLRYLLATPYNRRQAWEIDAVKYKRTIYMCLLPSQEQRQENLEEKKFRQYGFKFESNLMADHPQRNPKGSTEPVFEGEEFNVVMSRSINGLKLIFGNEIDGVKSDHVITSVEELNHVPLVEVKSREIQNYEEHNFNKFKVLLWYCQASVADITEIYIGMRNNEGIIENIKVVNLKDAMHVTPWEISICENFLNNFLQCVKYDMRNIDDANEVFRYSWNPNVQQHSIKLEKISYKDFLPEKFVSFMNNL
ncbi:hypothetical protein PVAND_001606 [Polypedilum vanderplanki]|uniref:Decapping nuclease n=1 Tax=Polypedilum vanderplanki TaxID=319348 RepID=A0A9J6BNX3_POLVA|nr:hypothetical protein PVAND_001606 [Polypedilum vanderplanki]